MVYRFRHFWLQSESFKKLCYSIGAFSCLPMQSCYILCFAEVSSRFDKTGGPYYMPLYLTVPSFLRWLFLAYKVSLMQTDHFLVTYPLSFFNWFRIAIITHPLLFC